MSATTVPDGLVAVVKRDCPTCVLVEPVLRELAAAGAADRPSARTTRASPTASRWSTTASSRRAGGSASTPSRRCSGSSTGSRSSGCRAGWRARLGAGSSGVPASAPACPTTGPAAGRAASSGASRRSSSAGTAPVLASRTVELADLEDEVEAMYDRGWTDGLPVVPPTAGAGAAHAARHDARARRGRRGRARPTWCRARSRRSRSTPCSPAACPSTCRSCSPRVEAACTDAFNVHGLLATTYFSAPVVVVNGPVARAARDGLRGGNALGQGNRANATIGRALQLVVRNVGGGRPGEVDRADARQPGQVHVLLRRARGRLPVQPARRLPRRRGLGGHAVRRRRGEPGRRPAQPRPGVARPHLRPRAARGRLTPSSRSAFDALLVVGPEHGRVLREAGWDRERLLAELEPLLQLTPERVAARRGRRSPRACRRAWRRPAAEVPARRAAAGARRRRRGDVLGRHRRLGERRRRQHARDRPVEEAPEWPGPCSTPRPSGSPRHGQVNPRPASLAGLTVGLLDISKPRGDVLLDRLEELLQADGVRTVRYRKPTFAKPAPVDLRHEIATALRGGDRGARRLRLVHVVQCARHRRPRVPRSRRGLPGLERVRRRRRRPVRRARPSRRRTSSSRTRSRTAPTTSCARWPRGRTPRSWRR